LRDGNRERAAALKAGGMETEIKWLIPCWLRSEEHPPAGWSLKIEQPEAFFAGLGPLAVPLMRCVFFADRIASLNALYYHAAQREEHAPVSAMRDTHSLFVLTAGNLHEFADAVEDLRRIDARSMLTPETLSSWEVLGDLARDASRASSGLYELRSKAAFHCDDKDIIERGIALIRGRPSVTFASADDHTRGTIHLALGQEVVMSGLYPNLKDGDPAFSQKVRGIGRLAVELPVEVQRLVCELINSLAPKIEWCHETESAWHRQIPTASAPDSPPAASG
jgi:hypothetical protein